MAATQEVPDVSDEPSVSSQPRDGGAVPAPPAVRVVIPMLHVADVPRSIAFYAKLGFGVRSTFVPPGAGIPSWAMLHHGAALLMVARASGPIDPEQQAVLFYLYYDDAAATREALLAAGVEAGPLDYPMYAPRGVFRVADPDGYGLMLMHT